MSRRVGKWTTVVDDQVVMGGAPFGWLKKPEKLNKDYGVTGVINLCEGEFIIFSMLHAPSFLMI